MYSKFVNSRLNAYNKRNLELFMQNVESVIKKIYDVTVFNYDCVMKVIV